MTGHADEHERTMAFAEIALGQIKALRQPATPRNYEIWYAYATGYHPSLNQKINELLGNSGTLSDAELEEIYETYLSPTRLSERIDTVGSKVMGEIEQVMAMIDAAAGSATTTPKPCRHDARSSVTPRTARACAPSSKAWCRPPRRWKSPTRSWKSGSTPPSRKSTSLQVNLETVRTESLTDPLTQLANRKFFDTTLEQAIADAHAKNEPLSLMMTDIDHFKNFNDSSAI